MARPLRVEYPGAFYHITSRGNERKDIFRDLMDRERFLSYLDSASERYGAGIHVYCLMSNHYHLLLETPLGNLSQIMHHINGAYTMYFNVRHRRSGHLFQGRFRAILVEADEYAKELSRYIHLNPIRAGIADRVDNYPWSSYRYYTKEKKAPDWLIVDFILGYFGSKLSDARESYSGFVNALNGQQYESPLKKVVASTILGSLEFVDEIKERFVDSSRFDRDLPALRELSTRMSIETIKTEVEVELSSDGYPTRQLSIYLCHKYSCRKLKEIGSHFGISESGVTQASRRVASKISKDSRLRKKVKKIENKLKMSKV